MVRTRWTIADLELLPEPWEDKRYEIIDGELYVSTQPHYYHQLVGFEVGGALRGWSADSGAGHVNIAPGLIFAEDEAVAPDVVWTSAQRIGAVLGSDGKLHAAPDLVVEVLSPGRANEQRDRQAKLGVYSRRGVREYWIADWRQRQVHVYRRVDMALQFLATLLEDDVLQSPLLPGFALSSGELFAGIPTQ